MSRLVNAWRALRGLPQPAATKARPPLVGYGGYYVPGTGQPFIPPGSRWDFLREAGDLRRNSVVDICVRWLVRQWMEGEWECGAKNDDGEWEAVDGHPLIQVLDRCNPFWPGQQTHAGAVADFVLFGNAYYKIEANANGSGLPVELYWLPAQCVYIDADPDPLAPHPIRAYRYQSTGGQEEQYEPSDVVHVRDYPDPDNPLVGIGRIQSQIRNVVALNHGERWTGGILRNGTAGKMVSPKVPAESIMAGAIPDENALAATANHLRQAMGGDNAGRMSYASLPVELLDVGETPESMLIDRILDRPEAMVVTALGLNTLALNLPSSAETRTYANKAEANREAMWFGVVPVQDAFADAFALQLLTKFDASGAMRVWKNRDEVLALQDDADERVSRASTAFQSTMLKRNEAREQAGIDPLPDGDPDGELYYGDTTTAARGMALEDEERQREAMQGQQGMIDGDGEPLDEDNELLGDELGQELGEQDAQPTPDEPKEEEEEEEV